MSDHTPGPWYADMQFVVGQVPTGRPRGEVIGEAKVFAGSIKHDVDHQANARLMAAAPDLLEAVETSLCPDQMDPNRTAKDCYEAGICGCNNGVAIAKARGESA